MYAHTTMAPSIPVQGAWIAPNGATLPTRASETPGMNNAAAFAEYASAPQASARESVRDSAPQSARDPAGDLAQDSAKNPAKDAVPPGAVSQSQARMPTAGETRPAPRPDTIDGRALVEEIATKWEKEGVNPAWVKIIREPRTWMRLSPSDQPAIVKLAKDLPPGGISALRKQAIRLIRDTPLWQKLLDDRQRANHEPKISRSTLHRRLAAQTFGRKNSSPDKTTRVMYLLVNASMVSDAVKTRGPHTWDALQALGIDPAQAWRWQWRNQPGSMWP